MNKAEFQKRLADAEVLIEEGKYTAAVKRCDSLNLDLVTNPKTLQSIAKAYEKCRRYVDAEDMLLMAREYAPRSRSILFHLCNVAVKAGDLEDAQQHYEDFCKLAGDDSRRFVLQYRLAVAQKKPTVELIDILETFKAEDPDDHWMYVLAQIYASNGLKDKAIEVCDEIEVWFANGKAVAQAQALKAELTGQPAVEETEEITEAVEEAQESAEEPAETKEMAEEVMEQEASETAETAETAEEVTEEIAEVEAVEETLETPSEIEETAEAVEETAEEVIGAPAAELSASETAAEKLYVDMDEAVAAAAAEDIFAAAAAFEAEQKNEDAEDEHVVISLTKQDPVEIVKAAKAEEEAASESEMEKEFKDIIAESEGLSLDFPTDDFEETPEAPAVDFNLEIEEKTEDFSETLDLTEEIEEVPEELSEVAENIEEAAEETEEVIEEIAEEAAEVEEETVSEEVVEETEETETEEPVEEVTEDSEEAAEEEVAEMDTESLIDFDKNSGVFLAKLAKKKEEEELFGNLPVNPQMTKNIWHFMVFGNTNAQALECARERIKEIDSLNSNCPSRLLKIHADKIGKASIVNSLDRFLGNMVIVEEASMLSDEQLTEFSKVLDKDDRSLLIVFTDRREKVAEMLERVPALANSFTAIYEGKRMRPEDLLAAAKEYLFEQDASLSEAAEQVVLEEAERLLNEKKGSYVDAIRDFAEAGLKKAERGGFLGFGGGKIDKNGILQVDAKHFKRSDR